MSDNYKLTGSDLMSVRLLHEVARKAHGNIVVLQCTCCNREIAIQFGTADWDEYGKLEFTPDA